MEPNRHCVRCPVRLEVELGSLCFVSEVRVEDVELIALDHLWRRVLRIVMRLVVLVPLETLFNAIKEAGLASNVQGIDCVY
jgi:hypothetical protein